MTTPIARAPLGPGLPGSWVGVLESIERSLAEAMLQAAARDQPLPRLDGGGSRADAVLTPASLARLDERLAALQQALDRAGQAVAAADAEVAAVGGALNDWLQATRRARGKLSAGSPDGREQGTG